MLSLAFATLNSITRSLDQASNIQRSTQLFFASESGAEAAFFHHNARTPGVNFTGAHASQSINHSSIDADTTWTIQGRTSTIDGTSNNDATIVDILQEGQTLKIPLRWDSSANPTADPPQVDPGQYAAPNNTTDNLDLTFYIDPDDISASSALDAFNAKYNFESDAFDTLADGFNFGNPTGNNILIDWSLSRKNNNKGIQTFIPTDNKDCTGFGATPGYICENDFVTMTSGGLQLDTNDTISGKVLPGSYDLDVDDFWNCTADSVTADIGDVCTDFQITFRPLLQFYDTIGLDKIPGLPYELKLTTGSSSTKPFPQSTYTVISDVALEDFSQKITIEVPEKTSIGAFDYVIFD